MKKTILLAIATLFATVTFAQQQLATLNHNDTISVFYGSSALVNAFTNAVDGDIITLSSGTFNAVNITKAVTIRGNGMTIDTIAGTSPTIITGDFSVNIPNGSTKDLSIQAVYMSGTLTCYYAGSPTFNKCRFNNYYTIYTDQISMNNAMFVNCIVSEIKDYNSRNNQYINCIILNLITEEYVDRQFRACTFRNCIAKISPTILTYSVNNVAAATCVNCVLFSYGYYFYYVPGANPIACNNCIGFCSEYCGGNYFTTCSNGNQNFPGFSSVFKFFNGTYSDGISFELQDSIAANVLGNDGIQIGVYGGMVPFNPRVNTPRYVNCSVAPHTTLDGKLSVDIEVVSE